MYEQILFVQIGPFLFGPVLLKSRELDFFFATVSGCKHLFWRLLMKNLSWAVLGLLLCVPFTGAETIDSVSFNPARLGRYETLKVSDQLTTKGGIEANAVTVQSGGTAPTGGSLTLGENAIPEPTQSCSNLRWVERTTITSTKYWHLGLVPAEMMIVKSHTGRG